MKIYNTLTGKKEEFKTIEPGVVRMYVCGPTVYNFFHIGNARPFLIFDTFRNFLEYKGFEVKYVQNFTDIDDKIINRAKLEEKTALEISERYIEEYFKDARALGIKDATHHPKVSEYIDEIIDFIKVLEDKGYAYAKNGNVYFSTGSYEEYGKLSKQDLEALESGSRVQVNQEKEDPLDFVLWKAKKEGEPSWESPWGEGRPGWHIECSVMSTTLLGDTIDIHTGGQDLVFPHHENEVAQTEAKTGKEYVKYWMHNGYINIDNQKMSKSKGNFFTVREILEQYDPEVIRFFILSSHYRNPINFSEALVKSASNGLDRLYNVKNNLEFLLENADESLIDEEIKQEVLMYQKSFDEALEDDFNTANAISTLFELAKFINKTIDNNTSHETVTFVLEKFVTLAQVLRLLGSEQSEDLDTTVEALIEQRQEARANKDYAKADEIRDQLDEMGIELMDTREGVQWRKKK